MKANVRLCFSLGWIRGRVTGTIEIVGPAMPGIIKLALTGQEDSMLKFKLTLPPPGTADVITREIEVQVGEGTPTVSNITGDSTEFDAGLQGEAGDLVTAKLTDIDDAENRSPAREQSWTLLDTLAPPLPGEMGLTVTAEE